MKYYLIILALTLISCTDSWTDVGKNVWIDFNDHSAKLSESTTLSDTTNEIRIAVSSMTTPQGTFFKYHELFTYMEKKLNRKILLVQRKTYKEVNDLLKENKIDMAFICSGAYVTGKADSAFRLFLIPERNNQRYYQAYVVVNKESNYNSFEDLKGSRFTFSDSLSNTGRFYPLKRVRDLRITPEEFFSETYLSNAHDNSLELVNRQIVDGASVNSLIYDYTKMTEPEKVENIKIIERSPLFGMPPVVVSNRIDPKLEKELSDVMTSMVKDKEGRQILKGLMINRFVTDSDTLYNGIRKMYEGIYNNNLRTGHESTASLSP